MKVTKPIIAMHKAILQKYAWPGGYPLYLIMNDGAALCADCAAKEWKQIRRATLDRVVSGWGNTGWEAAGAEVNWEDNECHCDHCNGKIESAYGDADDEIRDLEMQDRVFGEAE